MEIKPIHDGAWQSVIVKDGEAIADAATSITVKLPRSNFIGGIGVCLRGTGGSGTPACQALIQKVEVVANSNSNIISTHPTTGNRQLRDIMQFRRKGVRSEIVNATGAATRVTTDLLMGRYKHDLDIIIPSFLFSSLDLKITFGTLIATTAFATGTVKLDVFVDEWVSPDAARDESYLRNLYIQKVNDLKGSVASAASGDIEFPLNIGEHLLAGIYAYASGTDGTTVTKFKLSLNNGAQTPIADTWLHSQSEDMVDYSLASGTKIGNVTMIDFDNPRTEQVLEECIPLSRAYGVEAADLVLTNGAGSQTLEAVQVSYVPVETLL